MAYDWSLQTNKVKKIIPFISLIHSVDSLKLIDKIENESEKFDKKTNILLQVHIAKEKVNMDLTLQS